MVIACSTNGQNIAMTIPKQHSDETVGLPTRASSKICPAFSGRPNDWLSPTDRLLNAHGIGQCGASYPISLLSPAPDEAAVANAVPLLVFLHSVL